MDANALGKLFTDIGRAYVSVADQFFHAGKEHAEYEKKLRNDFKIWDNEPKIDPGNVKRDEKLREISDKLAANKIKLYEQIFKWTWGTGC